MFKIAVFRERESWAQEGKQRTSEEFVSNQLGRDDTEAGAIESGAWVLQHDGLGGRPERLASWSCCSVKRETDHGGVAVLAKSAVTKDRNMVVSLESRLFLIGWVVFPLSTEQLKNVRKRSCF